MRIWSVCAGITVLFSSSLLAQRATTAFQGKQAVSNEIVLRLRSITPPALSRIAGLAIPASTIDRVVDEILARGRVARGYVGLGLQPVELPDHQKGLLAVSVMRFRKRL